MNAISRLCAAYNQRMDDDDHAAPITLAELRGRSGRSQTFLADRLGTTQSGVSRIERQDDTRISTLVEYVAHLGGRLRLLVEQDGETVELVVPALVPSSSKEPRRSRVIWQNASTRAFYAVGVLEFAGDTFRFQYSNDILSVEGFVPFEGFPDTSAAYESAVLFEFFAKRLTKAADPSFHLVIEALGLSRREATPVELLAYPFRSQQDPIQLQPEPTVAADGTVEGTFLVSGVRHADAESDGVAARLIERLAVGDRVDVSPDPTNSFNPRAFAVEVDGLRLGYVPDFLLADLEQLRKGSYELAFSVERANGGEADWHLRLLLKFVALPERDA